MDASKRSEIINQVNSGQPFKFSFKYAGKDKIMFLNSILARLLSRMDRIFLLNSIVTIVREIVVNAQKANAKRIFFKMNNLDIREKKSYDKGMILFKENVIGDFDSYKKIVLSSDYFIGISFEFKGVDLYIRVWNNAPILPEELVRVKHRISKALQYSEFSDAYGEIEDDSEGAGLGIVLTILFLKSMGIDPKTFSIDSNGKITETNMVIPKQLRPVSITTKVKDEIIREVDGIPTFPENVIQLQELCRDPEATMDDINSRIIMDPALSTDVIKLSNSAGFVPGKRIESVHEAVMTIGLKNVEAILVASNARKIMNERFSMFEEIWDHCNKTAFYARAIALKLKKKAVVENVFLAGLLHDLGKIILLSTDKALVKKIADQVKERKIISSTIMEEISIGISHSAIGGLVSEKWTFPDYLVESITHHHAPLNSSEKNADHVHIVYLANMMCGIESRKYYYDYLDESILENYGILGEQKFNDFHKSIKNKYENAAGT